VHGTFAFGINSGVDIVGLFVDGASTSHGFLLREGRFITIDHPDAAHGTSARAINGRGQIVGFYFDSTGAAHGFLLSDDEREEE
jgi:hypothetical protein